MMSNGYNQPSKNPSESGHSGNKPASSNHPGHNDSNRQGNQEQARKPGQNQTKKDPSDNQRH